MVGACHAHADGIGLPFSTYPFCSCPFHAGRQRRARRPATLLRLPVLGRETLAANLPRGAVGQIAKDEAYRNTCVLEARLPLKTPGVLAIRSLQLIALLDDMRRCKTNEANLRVSGMLR